ncbi:MAG TPA: hypothetical protein VED22_00250 [Nitrososphaerales archaeon]|nr:hypothetical protein [Nitrososphaerales archaeon]
METTRPSRLPLLASVVVLVVLAAGLGYVYVTSSQTISSDNSTISSQQSQIGDQSAAIASQSGVISSQSATIQSQSATISSQAGSIVVLQANVTAFKSLVSSLNTIISSDRAELASLDATLGTDNATIATDGTTIATDVATINSLHSQIALAQSVEANYSEIVNLSYSEILVSNLNVTIYGTSHASSTPFVSFSPNYAGYLYVNVSAFTLPGYYLNTTAKPANLNLNGVYEQWTFLAPSSSPTINYAIIPVSPGTLNTIALLAAGATDGTAIVSATYYY